LHFFAHLPEYRLVRQRGGVHKRFIFGQWPVMELRLSEELPNGNASAMLLADPVLVSEFVVSCAPAFILGRRRSISGSCRRTISWKFKDGDYQLPSAPTSTSLSAQPGFRFVKQLTPKLEASIEYFGSFGPIGAIRPWKQEQ
jgi:hypothetical protein